MKAIETRYAGYRFRSRLEARWAVFFDAMGMAWEYEPEGFIGETGMCYLPDFRIEGRVYVEIKPDWPADKGIIPTLIAEREKWGGFLASDLSAELLVFFGLPRPSNEGAPGIRYYGDHRVERIRLLECRKCDGWAWSCHGFVSEVASTHPDGFVLQCRPGCTSERFPIAGTRLLAAVESARSARFEFGESGAG